MAYTTSSENIITSRSTSCSTGAVSQTSQVLTTRTKNETRTATVKRIKPEDLTSGAALTPLSGSKTHVQYGIVRKDTPSWCTTGGVTRSNGVSTVRKVLNNPFTGPTVSTLNLPDINPWLGVRQKFEDREWNLGGYIGEYDETIKLFQNVAKGLKTAWDVAHGRLPKKIRIRNPKSTDVSAAWINSQWAIKPLVSDLHEGINYLNQAVIDCGKITTKVVHTQKEFYKYGPVKNSVSTAYAPGFYVLTTTMTTEIWKSTRIIAYADHDLTGKVIDWGSPLEWIWEGIPFSAIVDYAIGIGDYIGALNAMDGYTNIRAMRIDKIVAEYKQSYGNDIPLDYNARYFNERDWLSRGISFNRTILPSGSIPPPPLPTIQFTDKINHLANAVALLHLLRK